MTILLLVTSFVLISFTACDRADLVTQVVDHNDPWTGAAIPNSVTGNPNVRKFIIPHGTHNDDILSDENWGSKGEEIYDAINAFLQEGRK